MLATEMLLERHAVLHGRNITSLFEPITEEQARRRPAPGVNTIVWLVWHIARCEDVGVNRLVTDGKQVLEGDGWLQKLNVPLRNYGTGMGDDEVEMFSDAVNISALRGYFDAVGQRTVEVVKSLRPQDLDVPADPERQRKILYGEGVLGANAEWVPAAYAQLPAGAMLAHLSLTHSFGHMYEAFTVRGLLGIRRLPDDGKGKAVPGWKPQRPTRGNAQKANVRAGHLNESVL